MKDTFYVLAMDGSQVLAKYLTDKNGKIINNPVTGKGLIVPENYDPSAVLQKFHSMVVNASQTDVAYGCLVYAYFYLQFRQSGDEDLQRSYNGIKGSFVPEFQQAASYNLGLAARAAELVVDEPLLSAQVQINGTQRAREQILLAAVH